VDKDLTIHTCNNCRHVQGILQGFDPFMNFVIDECVEISTSRQQNNIGKLIIGGNCGSCRCLGKKTLSKIKNK
uniref:Sm domain-containing protein n=1 Tax=Sus scrofa TaxID=9823 RepID=A0A4X1TT24_PIG